MRVAISLVCACNLLDYPYLQILTSSPRLWHRRTASKSMCALWNCLSPILVWNFEIVVDILWLLFDVLLRIGFITHTTAALICGLLPSHWFSLALSGATTPIFVLSGLMQAPRIFHLRSRLLIRSGSGEESMGLRVSLREGFCHCFSASNVLGTASDEALADEEKKWSPWKP